MLLYFQCESVGEQAEWFAECNQGDVDHDEQDEHDDHETGTERGAR